MNKEQQVKTAMAKEKKHSEYSKYYKKLTPTERAKASKESHLDKQVNSAQSSLDRYENGDFKGAWKKQNVSQKEGRKFKSKSAKENAVRKYSPNFVTKGGSKLTRNETNKKTAATKKAIKNKKSKK